MEQNNSKNVCDEAYNHAIKILENCSHSVGIKASAKINGYPQVWARDSMITLFGAVLTKNSKIIKSLKSSFDILKTK